MIAHHDTDWQCIALSANTTRPEITRSLDGQKGSNPIDKHVGSRVRMRRMMLSMSQEKLGRRARPHVSASSEIREGTNRIGASRLQQISNILQVPVSFFFEGAPDISTPTHDPQRGAPTCLRRRLPRHLGRPRADQGVHADQRTPSSAAASWTWCSRSPETIDTPGLPADGGFNPSFAHILTPRPRAARNTPSTSRRKISGRSPAGVLAQWRAEAPIH